MTIQNVYHFKQGDMKNVLMLEFKIRIYFTCSRPGPLKTKQSVLYLLKILQSVI